MGKNRLYGYKWIGAEGYIPIMTGFNDRQIIVTHFNK